jgi:hypothetical protein
MTSINLFTENYIGEEKWKEFIIDKNDFLKNLYTSFIDSSIYPDITFNKLKVTDIISIIINIPYEENLKIQNIAKKFNISNKIPPKFHITLAYQYKYCDNEIKKKIKKQLEKDLKKHLENLPSLDKSSLTYFNDMTNFNYWDGEGFPFK